MLLRSYLRSDRDAGDAADEREHETLGEELLRDAGDGRDEVAVAPVYFVATDRRFGDALRGVFGPTGHADNARLVVLGQDDPGAIPDGAPTYIMRSARAQLGDTPLTGRVIQTPRVFSTESARELLTFIVRANIAAMAARGGMTKGVALRSLRGE